MKINYLVESVWSNLKLENFHYNHELSSFLYLHQQTAHRNDISINFDVSLSNIRVQL